MGPWPSGIDTLDSIVCGVCFLLNNLLEFKVPLLISIGCACNIFTKSGDADRRDAALALRFKAQDVTNEFANLIADYGHTSNQLIESILRRLVQSMQTDNRERSLELLNSVIQLTRKMCEEGEGAQRRYELLSQDVSGRLARCAAMRPSYATTSYVQLASQRLEHVDRFLRDGFAFREELVDILCKLAHTEDATAQLALYASGDGPLTDSFIIDMVQVCVMLRLALLRHQFFGRRGGTVKVR